MDVAFSLIKRDYIFATDCNYDDTANLQIRCPFCFEPLFLKSGGTNKDHFSHYAESLNSADCELRSRSYYSSYSEFESETKGQTLLKHYRMFSNLYSIYMGIPKQLVLFSDTQYEEIIAPTIELIKRGTSDLEQELQRDNMKDFLSLSLKTLFNAITIMNLEIPELNIFYELYKESMQGFLDLIDKRIFDYNKQGTELLNKKLQQKIIKTEKYSQHLLEQVLANREYVIKTLATRFSIAEIKLMLFGGIIKKNIDIHNSILRLTESIKKKTIVSLKTINGKRNFMSTKYIKYISEIDVFKISLFLGQQNIIFYNSHNPKKNITEYKIYLLNPNIDFFERLSRISSFSTSQKSLFFNYYNWGPIPKRNYPIYKKLITEELQAHYLGIYYTEEQKQQQKILKQNKEEGEPKQKRKTRVKKAIPELQIEESHKSPTFIIHKKNETKPTQTVICRICKQEIPTYRLRVHLKMEHPKRK